MKEDGIGKLIELLNEYEGDTDNPTWTLNGANEPLYGGWTAYASAYLIPSKKYGFIQRLVENDKIDFDKVMKLGIPCFVRYDKGEIISVHDVDFDRQLIMLISISDTPIEDLISYLKIS